MRKHEETLRLIDSQVRLLTGNLRETSPAPSEEKKTELRSRIEALNRTKLKLTLDQENEETHATA